VRSENRLESEYAESRLDSGESSGDPGGRSLLVGLVVDVAPTGRRVIIMGGGAAALAFKGTGGRGESRGLAGELALEVRGGRPS
jgi:hypothetical protein